MPEKKFLEFLNSLDHLPIPSSLGSLNIYHLKMLQLIKSRKLNRTQLVHDLFFQEVSPAQRYRYINDLIHLQLIEYSNGTLNIKS